MSGCFPLLSGCFRLLFDSACCVLDAASCFWLGLNCPLGGLAGSRCGFDCPPHWFQLLCASFGLFFGGFWLLLGELVSHRGVFGCLLAGLTHLLGCLGCSLGGLVCSFGGPGWFLPGFGWLPLRLLKMCAKSFEYSDVLLHIDDNRWTLIASLSHVASTCACLVFFFNKDQQQSPATELCCRAQQQMPSAECGTSAEPSSRGQQSIAEQSRAEQSTAAKQNRAEQSRV